MATLALWTFKSDSSKPNMGELSSSVVPRTRVISPGLTAETSVAESNNPAPSGRATVTDVLSAPSSTAGFPML